MDTNFFFSNFSGTSGMSQQSPRTSCPRKFGFADFEGHTELSGPHHFTWKTPAPPENIWTKKFRFGFLFSCLNKKRVHLFRIEMSFLWYRGGLSLLFSIEISFSVSRSLHSVVQHLDCLLPRINQCALFGASTPCKMEVKEDLDTTKKIKNLNTPQKTSQYQLKESPIKSIFQNHGTWHTCSKPPISAEVLPSLRSRDAGFREVAGREARRGIGGSVTWVPFRESSSNLGLVQMSAFDANIQLPS